MPSMRSSCLLLASIFAAVNAQANWPAGCETCKDVNKECKKESCEWGDYFKKNCKKTCTGCQACGPAPAPPPTPGPTEPPGKTVRRRKPTQPRRRRRSQPSSRRRSTRRRTSPPRRRRRSSSTRRRTISRRRRKIGGPTFRRRRKPPSPPPPPKGPPKEPRYDCKLSSKFDGAVAQYATTNFCNCDYGGSAKCSFICGGTKPNHGGNCAPEACSEKLVEFDAENTYIINVKVSEGKTGAPYRAFSYMKDVKVPSATTFSFTFKSNKHNSMYSKIFFWGDGNNILGLKPPAAVGGSSTFCLAPSTDSPLSMVECKGGTMECKDDTWYRVDMALTPPGGIALSINGNSVGSMKIQGFTGMPMIGVYHWGPSGGMKEDYQLRFRDMCLGASSLTNG